MTSNDSTPLVVTGMGIISGVGQGKQAFTDGLMAGGHAFSWMTRPGRQIEAGDKPGYIGAEISEIILPSQVPSRLKRNLTLTGQAALAAVNEAWQDANLDAADPSRIGLVVGGSNIQQRELLLMQEKYRHRLNFMRPNYAYQFMDSDIAGLCSEYFGIRGCSMSVGGASASGQLAIVQATQAVLSGTVEVCIAVGALMDLSYFECQAMQALGAMGSERFKDKPNIACRAFDLSRDGFIYGENCGAVVIERFSPGPSSRADRLYARISGWAVKMDGNRNPDPSLEGEVSVVNQALASAAMQPNDIDYINPHGTGSPLGDETEISALKQCQLEHAYINTTKTLVGHGLTSAGMVEAIAVMLQMQEHQLHPCRNLDCPIDTDFNWVRTVQHHSIQNAINLSIGFGGINTAVCFSRV